MSENKIYGKCPLCGGDVIKGQYGFYCQKKCGISLGKFFGKALSDEQMEHVLLGKEILVEDLVSKKTGSTYSIFAKMNGTEDFSYTKKDGTNYNGKQIHYETHFPERNDAVEENKEPVAPASVPTEKNNDSEFGFQL